MSSNRLARLTGQGADSIALQAIRPSGKARTAAGALSDLARQGRVWVILSGAGALTTRTRRAARDGLVAWAAASSVAFGIKRLTHRDRPRGPGKVGAAPTSSSMPSSHTAGAVAYATAASLRTPAVAVFTVPAAAAVAWSRAATGRHFPTDVAVGSLIGLAVGSLVRFVPCEGSKEQEGIHAPTPNLPPVEGAP
jgi:membrane-associated phospholipid phosphatase